MFPRAGRGFAEICVYQEKGATWAKGTVTLVPTRGGQREYQAQPQRWLFPGAAGLIHCASVCSSGKWVGMGS